MREKTVKVDSKHRIQNKINPYSITVGLLLLVFAVVLTYVSLWGFMKTFTFPLAYSDGDPEAFKFFPNIAQICDPRNAYPYSNASGEGEASGLFMNYQLVFANMQYNVNKSYYVGWNLDQVRQVEPANFPNEGWGFIMWIIFIWNSIWTCFAGTVLPMLMCAIVGYTCAKYRYKFSGFVYSLVVFTMVLPVVGTQPVTITLLQRIMFFDNPIGYLIWNCNFSSMYFMIFFSFYQSLADSYFEAAEIDGASQLRMLITIAIPLAKTMFAATFVVHFISTWTEYQTIMVYLPSYPTIAYGIHNVTVNSNEAVLGEPTVKLAALMLMALPALVFFTVFRKQLMGNISIGGIKE